MVTSVTVPGTEPRTAPAAFVPRAAPVPWSPKDAGEPAGRAKLWRLDGVFFCSIIGTCLGTGDLRKLVARATGERTEKLTDLEVHECAVRFAGNPDKGARLLHKTLDQRHPLAIRRFDRAKTPDEIRALWEEAKRTGDIPGAYWALLTHRAATRELRANAFGDVHMLSHLVGAANRADIRRLTALEAENARLIAKIERQEAHLRETLGARDDTIRRLSGELTRHIARQAPHDDPQPRGQDSDTTLHELIASLQRRLTHESARRERAEARSRAAESALAQAQAALRDAHAQQHAMGAELQALEARLAGAHAGDEPIAAAVAARVVLYVGGRPGAVQSIRDLVQRHGGTFLHHDGGLEERMRLIVGDIHRADWVFFPVDCVSHDAVILIKRTCAQAGKRYHALRTAGVTSFIAALARTAATPAQTGGSSCQPLGAIPASSR